MENQEYKILLVDDEEDILEFLGYNLRKEGYQVFTSSNGLAAIALAKEIIPNLIVLDIMMPEMDGIETCENLRKIPYLENVIITFLTARSEDYSQIAGFEAGGDDYITKPIKPKILVSRVKALLKRCNTGTIAEPTKIKNEKLIDLGNVIIDLEKYLVVLNGVDLRLPKKEFELLALLARNTDKVYTREEIYDKVWGNDIVVGDRTIDVHIRKLREKIGEDCILTIKGVGYKFEV